ncbi:hypothetical protein [Paenibacillus aestuarii]|uniref:Uncharacterized protein n=1 Tax=Paenibacillus aestuarii TaxID=516965 RepID=A0ABW0KED9_9BACL|nr:hypothetical protein [Paenibacillus aestuarii]
MFDSLFAKVYFAISGFKKNVKNLSGNDGILENEAVAMTRINTDDFVLFLRVVSSFFQEGLSEEDIQAAVDSIRGFNINEFSKMTYTLYHNDELVGLTMVTVIEQSNHLALYFLTEEKVANLLQEAIAMFQLPGNEMLQ